jgi:exosortase
MLEQWLVVESYSPGPLVPILMVIILWSQFRKSENRPVYPRRAVYVIIGIAAALGAVAYFGKEYKRAYPQYEIFSRISFDILFYSLTVLMVYASYLWKREEHLQSPEAPAKQREYAFLGLLAMVFGLVIHFLAMRGDLNRISVLAYIVTLYGFSWYAFGKSVGLKMMFPFAFLLFMLPMEFLDDFLGGPLRELATTVAVWIMEKLSLIIDMEVIRQGTKFTVDGKPFDVAPACSGLRSLVALSAIGAAYAYSTQPGVLRKWLLGLCAIPIAVATNVVRLVVVGVACHFFGTKVAVKVHDNAIPLYILAILFLFSLDKIFDRVSRWQWPKDMLKWLKIKDF